uniref:Zinc finger protein 385B-like n=1 Tax=Crassostrea virginica TaxID=6565 RepID=A0A8B8CET3_CRAVI|nr:zinc finger protein 385B-like [Crassostrea virginica]
MVFACSVCNVSLNSQSQLSQHQAGSKHLKKLKAAGGLVSVAADLVGTSHPSGKKTYGNFVSSDTLMPLKTALITPPKIQATTTTANTSNTEVPPPPPPPFPIEARPVTKAASPPPPPPPPPPKLLPTVHQQIPTMHQQKNTIQQIPPTQKKTPPGVNPVVQAIVDNALGKLPLKRKAYGGQCEICKVVYTSESHETQHLMGSKHAKKAKIAAAAEGKVPLAAFTGFNCTYCNVVLNSLDQLQAHREGQKHKNTVLKLQNQGKVKEECKDVTVVQV